MALRVRIVGAVVVVPIVALLFAWRPLGGAARAASPGSAAQPGGRGETVETVVFLRHGEKPPQGCGQLDAQGLNRALALSRVLPEKFGKPDYLFAPDPGQKMREADGEVNYVRPLATIEPTAIRYQMPVRTPCGYRDVKQLEDELAKPEYAAATVFVAWEHALAQAGASDLMRRFGSDASVVPRWHGSDFDSLYVVRVTRAAGRPATATFALEHEGLDGLSTAMPVPADR